MNTNMIRLLSIVIVFSLVFPLFPQIDFSKSLYSETYQDIFMQPTTPAPWPAGVTLHSGGYGYGYAHHDGTQDDYAMDFNGDPGPDGNPTGEMRDNDLLVLALADGCVHRVEFVNGQYVWVDGNREWRTNYGWHVVIYHHGGYYVRYAHLRQRPLVAAEPRDEESNCGPKVVQGQPIGQIGGTGTENNRAVHLHFSIYHIPPNCVDCVTTAIILEPMEDVAQLGTFTNSAEGRVQVSSQTYSVGYEAISGRALTNPDILPELRHQSIVSEYTRLGGQEGIFGRAISPVEKLPGTDYYYQEFNDYTIVGTRTFNSALLEVGSQVYMLPGPIWKKYKFSPADYGVPQASYKHSIAERQGWRVDFRDASMFWTFDSGEPEVWKSPWRASFCPKANLFSCYQKVRFDPYINFSIPDSNNPGPFESIEGFSTIWEVTFDWSFVSKAYFEYKIMGNARFYINDAPQGDWIRSEDKIIEGETEKTWHIFKKNEFKIRFYQSPGKPAYIFVKAKQPGFIIKDAEAAFYPDEAYESSRYTPPQYPLERAYNQPLSEGWFADYSHYDTENPLIPSDPVDQSENPPTRWSNLFDLLVQKVTQWYQSQLDKLKKAIEDTERNIIDDVEQKIEEWIAGRLNELLKSLEQGCASMYLLIGCTFLFAISYGKRKR
jgi:hypothetical protein